MTATLVALARGLAPRGRDTYARALVPRAWRNVLGVAGSRGSLRSLSRALSLGMVDHIALRTATIDAAVREGVSRGAQQVVVLGAGLDARAWRLDLRVPFFEVDHPSTQRRKAKLSQGFLPAPVFVPVDFETMRIADALPEAGYDVSKPTVWIWEGVTMYLPPQAVADTLAQVSELSAPGSRLVVTYLRESGVPLEFLVTRAFRAFFGEALAARYLPAAFRAQLEEVGFGVIFDDDSRGWERTMGGNPRAARLLWGERLAIAEC